MRLPLNSRGLPRMSPSGMSRAVATHLSSSNASSGNEQRFMHLTRIRPNNCAFKGVIIGSNPLEFNFQGVKIGGHAQDFTRRGETEQPEIARSGSGRYPGEALQSPYRAGLY